MTDKYSSKVSNQNKQNVKSDKDMPKMEEFSSFENYLDALVSYEKSDTKSTSGTGINKKSFRFY